MKSKSLLKKEREIIIIFIKINFILKEYNHFSHIFMCDSVTGMNNNSSRGTSITP